MIRYGMSIIKKIIYYCCVLFVTVGMVLGLINIGVVVSTYQKIISLDQLQEHDWIKRDDVPVLVFGAGIIDPQTPSVILQLRLDAAKQIYDTNHYKKMIMSGDHAEEDYNEVATMKYYLKEEGIPSEQIYLDHAGLSTYESLYRLKYVLNQDKVILVTQRYHLYRALMIAQSLGIQAVGVAAEESENTRIEREVREFFARIKDAIVSYTSLFSVEVDLRYGFSLEKSGDMTNEKGLLEVK